MITTSIFSFNDFDPKIIHLMTQGSSHLHHSSVIHIASNYELQAPQLSVTLWGANESPTGEEEHIICCTFLDLENSIDITSFFDFDQYFILMNPLKFTNIQLVMVFHPAICCHIDKLR